MAGASVLISKKKEKSNAGGAWLEATLPRVEQEVGAMEPVEGPHDHFKSSFYFENLK